MSPNWQKILLSLLLLSSCGVAPRIPSSGLSSGSSGESGGFSITEFIPASGTAGSLPTTVYIRFNKAPVESEAANTIAARSNYWVNCGGNSIVVSAVAYAAGATTASVTLPQLVGLAAGTTCTFTVSPSLESAAGERLSGARSAVYLITSN